MTHDVRTHATRIAVSGPEPADVAVGTGFILKVRVSCPAGCALAGAPVKVTASDGTAVAGELASEGAADFALQAPRQAGAFVWSVVFCGHEVEGIRHDEKTLPVRIGIKPQATSLAVWEIPSPVVTGEKFAVRVGAKSAADVALGGRAIAVCDEAGAPVAHGRLGETPLPGTSALYWTEVELLAPAEAGMHAWSVKFEPTELELPHDGAAFKFSVVVVKPPEHRLTIKVIEGANATPIEDAQVRLGAYRAATDRSGQAEIGMPKGCYSLTVWKVGYEAPATTVEVNEDSTVEIAILAVPEENPDAAWMM
jgi:hypothetical protein